MANVVDYAEAIEKAGGSAELAKELFGMLLQELPVLHEQLQQAIARAELQAIWDHAHKIHGSTAYCGVPELRLAASAMEAAVKSQQLDQIRDRFVHLDIAIQQVILQGPDHLNETW
jgi:two-component system sensor histidine kinase BarA